MEQVAQFFSWLFGTRQGVLCLILGGVVLCLILAIILERLGAKRYYNHEKSPDEEGSVWDIFDSDEE